MKQMLEKPFHIEIRPKGLYGEWEWMNVKGWGMRRYESRLECQSEISGHWQHLFGTCEFRIIEDVDVEKLK